MAEFTKILRAIEKGDRLAADQLLPGVLTGLASPSTIQIVKEHTGPRPCSFRLLHHNYLPQHLELAVPMDVRRSHNGPPRPRDRRAIFLRSQNVQS